MNSIEYIQPLLDVCFYFVFGIYFWDWKSTTEQLYVIFALISCLFYLAIVFPYKIKRYQSLQRLARIGMGQIGMISFVLSVLLTYQGDVVFSIAYWGTFVISAIFGAYLYKKEKKD